MDIVKLWSILGRFKKSCEAKGWKVEESTDLIKRGNEYHNFLYIRDLHPSTLRKIGVHSRSVVKEGETYRIVKVSYNAWICTKPLSRSVWDTLEENPELLERNAIYDLSELTTSGVCRRLNETSSEVFREFEKFLSREMKLKFKSARNYSLKTMS